MIVKRLHKMFFLKKEWKNNPQLPESAGQHNYPDKGLCLTKRTFLLNQDR